MNNLRFCPKSTGKRKPDYVKLGHNIRSVIRSLQRKTITDIHCGVLVVTLNKLLESVPTMVFKDYAGKHYFFLKPKTNGEKLYFNYVKCVDGTIYKYNENVAFQIIDTRSIMIGCCNDFFKKTTNI